MRLNRNALLFIIFSSWSITSTSGFIVPKAVSSRSDFSVYANRDKDAGVYERNQKMDALAEKCGDHRNSVVAVASQVEDIYMSLSVEEKNLVAFNVLLKAWGRVCQTLEKQKSLNVRASDGSVPSVSVHSVRDAVEHLTKHLMEAEILFEQDPNSIIVPDETSYNTAIDAWAKSTLLDSPEAAERLLKKMIGNPRLKPCAISYNSVLNCHARSRNPNSLEKMKKIWEHMENLAAQGDEKMRPGIRTVNIIFQGYSRMVGRFDDDKEKEACADEARYIFEGMKASAKTSSGQGPEADTYSFMMDVYGGVGCKSAALKAEGLMKELKQLHQETGNPRLQPNARTYTSLIGAWSRTFDKKSAIRAGSIVEEMERIYANRMSNGEPLRQGEQTTKPNAKTFKNWLYTIMYSLDDHKAKKALGVLMKMREYGKTNPELGPVVGTYNQAIDACARSRSNQVDALKIAFAIIKTVEIDKHIKANANTYAIGIKAAEYLLPRGKERNKLAVAVFDKAKKKGLVNSDVMKHAKKALDSDDFHELMLTSGQTNAGPYNVPRAWSKNVF